MKITREQVVEVLMGLPQDNRNPKCEYANEKGEPVCIVANALVGLGLPLPPEENNLSMFGSGMIQSLYEGSITSRGMALLTAIQQEADTPLRDEDNDYLMDGDSIVYPVGAISSASNPNLVRIRRVSDLGPRNVLKT
jgi:hypothetical protein